MIITLDHTPTYNSISAGAQLMLYLPLAQVWYCRPRPWLFFVMLDNLEPVVLRRPCLLQVDGKVQ